MGFFDAIKRGALGVATGGLSEGMGARPLLDAAGGSGYAKDLLFGGKATQGINTQPGHYDQATNQLGQIATAAGQRSAPTAATTQLGPAFQLAGGPQDQARAGLMGVTNRLGAIAGGQAPGAGELAVNRQVSSATAAQNSAARAARGANAALAFRNAARNTADIGLAGAGQAAQAQMADQQAANAQLGQMFGTMRGQDIDYASQNAQLGQQAMIEQARMGQSTALANLQAQLAQTGMNDQQQMQALGQMLGWDQAQIAAQIQKAQIAAGDKGILPGLLQAGGQIGAAYATGGLSAAAGGGGAPPTIYNPAQPLDGTVWGG